MVCGGEVICFYDAATMTSASRSQVRVFVSFYVRKRQPWTLEAHRGERHLARQDAFKDMPGICVGR